MPDLPLPTVAAAALAGLAYTVFGLTGFGAAIVGVPLLAHFFPIRFAVPMMLVFDLLRRPSSRPQEPARRRSQAELLRLAPFVALGMLLGITALVRAPERWLIAVLGVFVFAYAAWSLVNRAAPRPISAPAGPYRQAWPAASSPRSTAAAGRSTRSISRAASATRSGCARASPCSSSAPRGRAWRSSRGAAYSSSLRRRSSRSFSCRAPSPVTSSAATSIDDSRRERASARDLDPAACERRIAAVGRGQHLGRSERAEAVVTRRHGAAGHGAAAQRSPASPFAVLPRAGAGRDRRRPACPTAHSSGRSLIESL